MKKIIIIVSFILIAAGCAKDPLDITPNGRISLEDVFKDNNKTAAYLNSCYEYIQQYGGHYNFHTMLAVFTDEAHDNNEGQGSASWYNGGLTPNTNPIEGGNDWNNNFYGNDWIGIRKCNVFLKNIDQAGVNSAADKARWKAEAKVLRAFYYWDLVMRYGPMPMVDQPFEATADFAALSRPSFQQSVDFIVRDCNEAIAESALPWRITTGSDDDRGRFTKAVAYAIRSQALLFNASPLWNPNNDKLKWQSAATASQEAINALTEANKYELFPDYGNFFTTRPDISASPVDKETILEMKRNDNVGSWQFFNGAPAVRAYKAGASPSQELVDTYEMKNGEIPISGYADSDHLQPIINPSSGYKDAKPYENRDPRFYASVFFNGGYYGNINGGPYHLQSYVGGSDGIQDNDSHFTRNGYYMHKFINGDLVDQQNSGARFRKFRLGELYLNLAEAENEANGPTTVAYDAVNAIRARPSVNMPALTGLSQAELRERIRNERRVELAFEEQRFWDVRRWKILDKTDRLTTGMKWVKNGSTFSNTRIVVDRRRSYESKFLIFPIPGSEITVLPKFDQNPGWQ